MRSTLLAIVATSLLGACVATVGPGRRSPPPAEPPPPPPPAEVRERHHEPRVIEGVVIDAATHQPIGRAAIDITGPAIQGEMTANTGPDGRFRTNEIPRGEFAIRVRREGYEVVERRATMSDGIAHIDIELQPKRR
jgi:Carboxypeptidase regulatory-like domain